jgi:hypothetical protein
VTEQVAEVRDLGELVREFGLQAGVAVTKPSVVRKIAPEPSVNTSGWRA